MALVTVATVGLGSHLPESRNLGTVSLRLVAAIIRFIGNPKATASRPAVTLPKLPLGTLNTGLTPRGNLATASKETKPLRQWKQSRRGKGGMTPPQQWECNRYNNGICPQQQGKGSRHRTGVEPQHRVRGSRRDKGLSPTQHKKRYSSSN